MKKWVLIVFLTTGLQVARAETSCQALVGTCVYYDCLSKTLACSRSNYLLSFGEKYCKKFQERRARFSSNGKKFLKSVQSCLQVKLEQDSDELVCKNSKALAAQHHVACYREHKFCNLKFMDQYLVVQTILKPVLVDSVFRDVAHKIVADCHRQ
jgi:hypothetical protein